MCGSWCSLFPPKAGGRKLPTVSTTGLLGKLVNTDFYYVCSHCWTQTKGNTKRVSLFAIKMSDYFSLVCLTSVGPWGNWGMVIK